MSSRQLHGMLAATAFAILVGILIGARSPRNESPAQPVASTPQVQPQSVPSSLPNAMRVAGSGPKAPAIVTFKGFPADVAQDPSRRYAFARDCAKFRHFDEFYRRNAANPDWPLDNPKKYIAMAHELRSQLESALRFLEAHRQSCEPWLDATPQDLENAQIYETALQAALRGDENAAACYVLAAWQMPLGRDALHPSPYREGVTNAYAKHAKHFAEHGLQTGNWLIVAAAYLSAREDHGIRTRAGFSPQDEYLFARLLQQGAPDGLSESEYGDAAAIAASSLPAAEVVALDHRAMDLYVNKFGRKQVSTQAVLDMCVNTTNTG